MIHHLREALAALRGWDTEYCSACGGWYPPHSH